VAGKEGEDKKQIPSLRFGMTDEKGEGNGNGRSRSSACGEG
jgi:hypothetical protein